MFRRKKNYFFKSFNNFCFRHTNIPCFFFSSWTSNQAGESKLTFLPAVSLCCHRFGVAPLEGWNGREREIQKECVCECQNGDGGSTCATRTRELVT